MQFVNKITGQLDEIPRPILKPIIKEESFVLAASDADIDKCLRCNSINNIDVFIPNNSDVPFPIGVVITVEQMGNGIVTFKAMPGVVINGDNHSTTKQGMYMFAHKVNSNIWNIIDKGDSGAPGPTGPQGLQGLQGTPGSDAAVTKLNVEAVLTGEILSHTHPNSSTAVIPIAWGRYF